MKAKRHGKVGHPSLLPCILLLAVFFLVGVLLGQILICFLSPEVGRELTEYIEYYVAVEESPSVQTIFSTVFLYFRYPVLAVFLGFTSLGILFIPGITLLFGFLSSFSVSCFTAAFGIKGVWLAVAVYGIRCVLTLPCFFVLGVPALYDSVRLTSLFFGKGRRVSPIVYGRIWWVRTAICMLILIFGVCVDLVLSPFFVRLVLDRIFIF